MLLLTGQAVSLAEPIEKDGHEPLESTLEQSCVPSVERELVKQSVRDSLYHVMQELDDKERTILRLRFGLEDDKPRTLRQIGTVVGLSRERVRQLQNKALRKAPPEPQSRSASQRPRLRGVVARRTLASTA